MKPLLKLLSFLGLALVIIPPVLYLLSLMDKPAMSGVMLAGTILWFVSVPFWVGRER